MGGRFTLSLLLLGGVLGRGVRGYLGFSTRIMGYGFLMRDNGEINTMMMNHDRAIRGDLTESESGLLCLPIIPHSCYLL